MAIAFSPVILGIVLILLPLINNKGDRSPLRRPWAIAIVTIIVTMVASFWYIGQKSPWSPAFQTKPLSPEIIGNVSTNVMNGGDLFYKKACIYCHTVSGYGGKRGPDLSYVGSRLTSEQITIKTVNGGGNMPSFGASLTRKDLNDLTAFLLTRKK